MEIWVWHSGFMIPAMLVAVGLLYGLYTLTRMDSSMRMLDQDRPLKY